MVVFSSNTQSFSSPRPATSQTQRLPTQTERLKANSTLTLTKTCAAIAAKTTHTTITATLYTLSTTPATTAMPKPATYLLHPIPLRNLASAEEKAPNLTPTCPQIPKAMEFPEGSPHGTSSPQPTVPTTASPSPTPSLILLLPTPLPSTPTPCPPQHDPLDTEFHFIETELAMCKMTHGALSRRQAALEERKRDILRETKMRLDREVSELEARDEAEEEEWAGKELFMRDVGRRGRGSRGSVEVEVEVGKGGEGEAQGEMVVVDEGQAKREDRQEGRGTEEKKVIPMSAKGCRRQGMIALLQADPRLARRT